MAARPLAKPKPCRRPKAKATTHGCRIVKLVSPRQERTISGPRNRIESAIAALSGGSDDETPWLKRRRRWWRAETRAHQASTSFTRKCIMLLAKPIFAEAEITVETYARFEVLGRNERSHCDDVHCCSRFAICHDCSDDGQVVPDVYLLVFQQ